MVTETRRCERCGNEIGAERIEALPETQICVECSKQTGGEYERHRGVAVNVGRGIKNITGGYDVLRRRRRIDRK